MKRGKLNSAQLSLLEPICRWSDLPLDVQQKLVDQLGQLLTLVSQPGDRQAPPPSRADHDTCHAQENQHD
jgi:hypothetical protein